MKVLALVALLLAYTAAECLDGSEPEAQDLTSCEWYSDSTCCVPSGSSDDGEESVSGPCKAISTGCEDQITLLTCASCSPDVASFTEMQNISGILIPGKARICTDFADKVFDSCKNDEFPVSLTDCKKIGDEWSDGEDFFTNGPFSAIYEYGGDPCFNAGEIAKPLAALAVFLCALFAF